MWFFNVVLRLVIIAKYTNHQYIIDDILYSE